jgi:hypothetical protein
MQFLQTITDGEAVSKPRRRRKSYWRKRWITLTKGTTLDNRAIKQTMRCPKLLSGSMPRVILKEDYLQRPRSAESDFGLRFVQPEKKPNRRFEERREHDEGCTCDEPCAGSCITERRKFNRRSCNGGERKPDKYFFNPVQVDPIKHTVHLKKPELIFAGSALGKWSKAFTSLTERRSVAFDRDGRKIPLPERLKMPFDLDIS